ncbi:MAG: redoxin domain-containing protein [Phycisphaerales bacterium]
MFRRTMLAAAAVVLAASGAAAQTQKNSQNNPWSNPSRTSANTSAPELRVGDRAPELSIEKWVKGDPITGFEKGRVYVVEFWASWCQPCLSSMPALTELQKEYGRKGVTIVGVTSEDPNNALHEVEALVAEKGDTIGYTVAWDSRHDTHAAWMNAADQSGVPTAFVVDKNGGVAFIGHPMWLSDVLPKVVKGSWKNDVDNATIESSMGTVNEAWRLSRTDPKAALAALKTVEAKHPKLPETLVEMRFNLFLKAGEYDKAYSLGDKLVDKAVRAKNASGLNEIAWAIVDPEAMIEKRDLRLAFRAAETANELTGWNQPHILDTLARVYFTRAGEGDIQKAVELQTKAIDLAEPELREQLTSALEEFKNAMR